ncbi:unnamed protein product, partial [Ectocarpus sp. 4 AP-2014]
VRPPAAARDVVVPAGPPTPADDHKTSTPPATPNQRPRISQGRAALTFPLPGFTTPKLPSETPVLGGASPPEEHGRRNKLLRCFFLSPESFLRAFNVGTETQGTRRRRTENIHQKTATRWWRFSLLYETKASHTLSLVSYDTGKA